MSALIHRRKLAAVLALACMALALPQVSAQGQDPEPNDTPNQAVTVLLPFFSTYGKISDCQDVDYFKFNAAAGTQTLLWLDVLASEEELTPVLALYNSAGQLIAYNQREWNMGSGVRERDPILYLKLPYTGDYYIAVLSKARFEGNSSAESGSSGGYALYIQPSIDGSFIGDGCEPNDARTNASTITLPFRSLGANLLYFGDIDWYRFTAAKGERISVDVDALEMVGQPGWDITVQPVLGLFDSGGSLLSAAGKQPDPDTGFPEDLVLTFDVPRDGSYFIAVASAASPDFSSAYSDPDFLADPEVSSARHRIGSYGLRVRKLHTLLFPQIASGSFGSVFFSTSLLLVNPSGTETTGRLSFYAPDGAPLELSLQGATVNANWFTIPPKGSVILRTDGSGPGETGYAKVVATGPIGGSAVFSEYTDGGELLTEAAVEPAPPLEFSVFPVDVTQGYNTGVALANPLTDTAINLYFKLVDLSGESVAARSIILAAGHQMAVYVSGPGQLFPNITHFRGSLQVFADYGVPAVALRSSSRTLTTLPAASMNQSFQSTSLHFPYVVMGASGSAYRSTIVLTNPGYFPVNGTIKFQNADGSPMTVQLGSESASVHRFRVGAQGSLFLESSLSQTYGTGYALVEANHAVGAVVIFSQYDGSNGRLVTEVGIPAAPPSKNFMMFVEFENGYNTGIAVANVNAAASNLQYVLRQNSAPDKPLFDEPVSMDPGAQSAGLIAGADQLFPGFTGTGTLEVIASQAIPGVAIRLTATTLTAVPVIPIP
jgi:hypothetical protein